MATPPSPARKRGGAAAKLRGGTGGSRAFAAETMDFRDSVPEEHCAYGIIGCGAATGDGKFVEGIVLERRSSPAILD